MRQRRARAWLLGALWMGGAQADAPLGECLVVRPDGVTVHYAVELATTPAARAQGLMARTSLPERRGMWFDFEATTTVVMWMKDTPLPLDMAFIDATGWVVFVQERTTPLSLTHIVAPQAVRYVLEVNGGELDTYGIAIGTRVILPVD